MFSARPRQISIVNLITHDISAIELYVLSLLLLWSISLFLSASFQNSRQPPLLTTTMATPEQAAIIPVFNRLFHSELNPLAQNLTGAARKALDAFVTSFNRLPRPEITPCFFGANHWHFSFRVITLQYPDMVLFMVNPGGRYVHIEHLPSLTLYHDEIHRKAHVAAVLLLKAFASESLGRARPWSLSTDSELMARNVSASMWAFDVADGLKIVGVTSAKEMDIVNEEWFKFLTSLLRGMNVDDDTVRDLMEKERKRIQASE